MISQDAETEEEVSRGDLVKGYEFEKDRYLLLDDDDFERARIESSSTLMIGKFVSLGSIDPIYFDTSYYVAPDDDAGQDVFVVLRDAIRKADAAALSRVVISRRERAVAIIPSGDGLVCHTLHDPEEILASAPLYEGITGAKPEAEMIALATQLINRQNGKFHPDDTKDRYEAKLHAVIEAKLKGEGITSEQQSEPDRGNVVDLMAALKASLGQGKSGPGQEKPPAPKKRIRKRAS
jgi:DNA end-binding protein Ku